MRGRPSKAQAPLSQRLATSWSRAYPAKAGGAMTWWIAQRTPKLCHAGPTGATPNPAWPRRWQQLWVRSPKPHRGGMSVAQGKTRSRGTPPWVIPYKTNPSPGGAAQGLGHNLPKSTRRTQPSLLPLHLPPPGVTRRIRLGGRSHAKPPSREARKPELIPSLPSRLRGFACPPLPV
jgi:hypothetical protein